MKEGKDIKTFVDNVSSFSKKEGIDLSSGEDLSIALMSLIGIEEHLFFSGEKLGTDKYHDMFKEVRKKRTELMKLIVKNPKGEEWCISKHLLAACYRLYEVGSKQLSVSNTDEAKKLFSHSFDLWVMFWGLQNVENSKEAKKVNEPETKEVSAPENSMSKLRNLVKKAVDCCIE
jgi:hypothetical protein